MTGFLTGRRMYSECNGIQSLVETIKQGSLQGSVLKAVLFNIATADFNADSMPSTFKEKFADDATFIVRGVNVKDNYEEVLRDASERCLINQSFLNGD